MNPSGPALFPPYPNPDKNAFAVSPDGRVLPASQYDPAKWHILVEGGR